MRLLPAQYQVHFFYHEDKKKDIEEELSYEHVEELKEEYKKVQDIYDESLAEEVKDKSEISDDEEIPEIESQQDNIDGNVMIEDQDLWEIRSHINHIMENKTVLKNKNFDIDSVVDEIIALKDNEQINED